MKKIPGTNIIPRKHSLENIIKEAKKFKTINEFRKNSPRIYQASWKTGMHMEITAHLKRAGGAKNKYVYRLYFPNKSVYIGLSFNPAQRFIQHRRSENKKLKLELKKGKPLKIKISNLMPAELAAKEETRLITNFRNYNWNVLNKAKGGALGGNIRFWNEENINLEAKKYKTRAEFQNYSKGAYLAALKLGILKKVCSFMGRPKNQAYTFQEMKEAALKFKRKMDFINTYPGMRSIMKKKGIYEELTSHMEGPKKRTFENLAMAALKFNTRTEFFKGDQNAYASAASKGILNQICTHMRKPWAS